MIKIILGKCKLYKNCKKFKCTLKTSCDGNLIHMNYEELCSFLKENDGVKFHDFVPHHIEDKSEFNNLDYITILCKNNEFYFMGSLKICKDYDNLQDIGFKLRFEF